MHLGSEHVGVGGGQETNVQSASLLLANKWFASVRKLLHVPVYKSSYCGRGREY